MTRYRMRLFLFLQFWLKPQSRGQQIRTMYSKENSREAARPCSLGTAQRWQIVFTLSSPYQQKIGVYLEDESQR